ncbi:MAG TPA: hypothetical protein VKB86_17530 [Pyrinomonadaceae bacterium]|nr:hypothetical protein [Pyrinomonadaceae bacterium]
MFPPRKVFLIPLIFILSISALTVPPLVPFHVSANPAAAPNPPHYTVVDLGTLGGQSSFGIDINNSGLVVVNAQTSDGSFHAFIWERGTKTELGTLGGRNSSARRINLAGQVLGLADGTDGGSHPVLWQNRIPTDLRNLNPDFPNPQKNFISQVNGLNDAGDLVGSLQPNDAQGLVAFLFSGNSFTKLDTPAGILHMVAYDVNAFHQVVGQTQIKTEFSGEPGPGFFWQNGITFTLPMLSGDIATSPTRINNQGQVIGQVFSQTGGGFVPPTLIARGVIWPRPFLNPVSLPLIPGATFSNPVGLNAGGQVVGRTHTAAGDRPFLWTDGQIYDLNDLIPANSGWILQDTNAINDDGLIVGSGIHDGQQHAFLLTSAPPCQVNPAQFFHQYDAPLPYVPSPNVSVTRYPTPANGPVQQYFGFLPSPNPPSGQTQPYVLCPTIKSGCALTVAATMLTSFDSLRFITPTSLDSALKQTPSYNTATIKLCPPNQPNCSRLVDMVDMKDWCEMNWASIETVAPFTVSMVDSQQAVGSLLQDQGSPVTVDEYLNDHVCKNRHRVILQLNEVAVGNNFNPTTSQHFVLVKGRSSDGNDWDVFDPGWNPANTFDNVTSPPPSKNITTLQGHVDGFFTNSGSTFRRFEVAGVRTYADISSSVFTGAITFTANSPAELVVVDSQGRRLGHLSEGDVFEIPDGSYFREFPFADDTDTGIANGDPSGIKTAHIPSPQNGTTYQVTVTGTGLGTYTLRVQTLAVDGTVQAVNIAGVTDVGIKSDYRIEYSSDPGSGLSVTRAASFDSALDDVRDSLKLGLIDNQGISNSLSRKIEAAAEAAARGKYQVSRNVLAAFKSEVNTQISKHINSLVAQVLLEDANSLLNRN